MSKNSRRAKEGSLSSNHGEDDSEKSDDLGGEHCVEDGEGKEDQGKSKYASIFDLRKRGLETPCVNSNSV